MLQHASLDMCTQFSISIDKFKVPNFCISLHAYSLIHIFYSLLKSDLHLFQVLISLHLFLAQHSLRTSGRLLWVFTSLFMLGHSCSIFLVLFGSGRCFLYFFYFSSCLLHLLLFHTFHSLSNLFFSLFSSLSFPLFCRELNKSLII